VKKRKKKEKRGKVAPKGSTRNNRVFVLELGTTERLPVIAPQGTARIEEFSEEREGGKPSLTKKTMPNKSWR